MKRCRKVVSPAQGGAVPSWLVPAVSSQSRESSAGAVPAAAEPNLLPLQLSCLFEMHRQPGHSSRRIISIETNWDVVRGIVINSEGMLPQALFIFEGAVRDKLGHR